MATATAVAQLNRVQYVGLDFPTHFDDLRSELQTKFAGDFNDFALSSLAIMLIDLTAYGLDTLSFYLDRRASDAYLETAQTRKAVARLTRQLGYKMGGAISSSTDVRVSIKTPVNFQVTIPVGFQFKGPNNLVFEVGEAYTFAPLSSTSALIPVYEGETVTETFVGDGTANQVYALQRTPSGKNVVQSSVSVLVNGTPYTEAEFLPISGGQYFEVGYNDDPATIRFGDGSISQSDIPGINSTISVTYIAAVGLGGQVAANTITKVVSNLVVNFQTIPLNITNPEAAVGGDDPESLTKAKAQAGLVYKTRRVAVTQSDYLALAGTYADPLYGRVAVAQAFSSRSASSDLELQALLQDVRDVISPVKGAVDAQVAALTVQTQVLADTAIPAITTATSDIVAAMSDADAALTSVGSVLAGVSNQTVLSASRCTDGTTTVAAVAAAPTTDASTTASFVQPAALGGTVTVALNTVTNLVVGSTVSIYVAGVATGTYVVITVPTATSAVFSLASVGSVALGGTVSAGAKVPTATDTLTNATKTSLLNIFSTLTSDLTTIRSNTDTAVAGAATALDAVTLVGDGTDGYTLTLINAAAQAATTTLVISDTIAPALTAAVAPLATTGTATETVNVALQAISDHVDAILSADCAANLVTVPILTKDADGFYAAPTIGLKQSLQTYLDDRKAVTQAVQVTSGESSLIKAILTVRVGVRQGFSENVVRLAVGSALDTLLKGRVFGASLYLSSITDAVLPVAGVAYVNPSIEGYLDPTDFATVLTTKIDAYGNLIINQGEVVSKASVTVVTELLTIQQA